MSQSVSWAWESDHLNDFKGLATSAWLRANHYASVSEGRLHISSNAVTVSLKSSQPLFRSEEGGKAITRSTIQVKRQGTDGFELGPPESLSCSTEVDESVVVCSYSPDGLYYACITSRKGKSPESEESYHLIVTDRRTASSTYLCLSAQKVHGAVCSDSQFGVLSWSPDGDKVMYVAEAKCPKSSSYFPASLDKPDASSDNSEDGAPAGDEFLYRNNWGEQLSSYHHTVPVIARWKDTEQCVFVPDGLPENFSYGQAIWGPDSDSILCVGWLEEDVRLGLIYCTQRPSALFFLNRLEGGADAWSTEMGRASVRSPALTLDSENVVFFEQDAGGPHHACSRLVTMNWKSKERRVIVPIVEQSADNDFPGIFVWSTSQCRCWSSDGQLMYFDTQWRSEQVVVSVDVTSGHVTRLSPESMVGSWTLLDVDSDVVLASYSNPASPPRLAILFTKQSTTAYNWQFITDATSLPVDYRIITLTPEPSESDPASLIPFEAILYSPQASEAPKRSALPLIVMPHGGPHSAVAAGYSATHAAAVLLGYCTVAVNYRGSSGFGQQSIMSLLGKIGTNDVADVQLTACRALDELPCDPSKVFVHGGSHGGFLTAHATGQFPSFYRGACMRNPVIDISAMYGVTDIPDWTMVEAGVADEPTIAPNITTLKSMLDCSPIVHVDKVTAPTLMLIGEKDLRVPPSQGHRYIKMLKSRGVKARLLSYPKDCHPLSTVKTQADCFVNMLVWFQQTL